MFKRKGYVYRFIGMHEEILYVGMTNNLDRRYKEHFKSKKNHLIKQGKGDVYNKVQRIEYITCKDEYTALQKELYYINLYKPRYNTMSKIKQVITPSKEVDHWKVYKVLKTKPNHVKINPYAKYTVPLYLILIIIISLYNYLK